MTFGLTLKGNLQAFSRNRMNFLAEDPDAYVEAQHEKRFLKLPNWNEIFISYRSHSEAAFSKIRIFMRKSDRVLWDKTLVNEHDELWYKAKFIPVIKDKFVEDLNYDGFYEMAISNWDGGKAP